MLEAFGDATDTMGIPLLDRAKIQDIWKTQRRHLHCIQDPPGVHLYMQTGQLVKGGITLPVFRCARGSTSLESFHLHLDRFIPGTSASAAHFQAYLLEGLARWNEDHAAQAVEAADRDMVCYSGQLQHTVNELSEILYRTKLVDDHTRPAKYTGELIGVQYLFSQTSRVLEEVMGRDPDAPDGTDTDDDSVDEGFQENEGSVEEHLENTLFGLEEDFARQPLSDKSQSQPAIGASQSGPADQETSPGDEAIQRVSHEPSSLGADTGPGYEHVVNLASSLMTLRHRAYVTQQQVAEIVALWERLPEGDKAPVRFPPRHQERLVKGRFRRKHSQTSVTPGVESLRRCMVGQGGQAAQMPNISRLVEAVCIELSRIHPEGTTICGVRVNRWAAVMRDYICIQENILTNPVLMAQTRIQLFPLNQRTLAQWHLTRTRELVRRALEMAVPLPSSSALASEPTPAVRPRPTGPEQSAAPCHEYSDLPDLSGQATQRTRGPVDVAPPIVGHPPCHKKHPPPSHSSRRLTLPLLRLHRHNLQYPAPLPGGGRKNRRRRSWRNSKVSLPNKEKKRRPLFASAVAILKQKSSATAALGGKPFVPPQPAEVSRSGWRKRGERSKIVPGGMATKQFLLISRWAHTLLFFFFFLFL
ncbi:uncharacterized protein LOC127529436 [Erpetoichthys calabaricus]|uniref:uncharacterized protein LOC127529436 n=1 Tax=Erpetoichthys calabaricus TaxID=27687 RepID=UPI002234839F|nr:uncharacterized protein LOC127529436 [Erpetoichthys calabaricus]